MALSQEHKKKHRKLKRRLRRFTGEDLGREVIAHLERTNRLADSPVEKLIDLQQRLRSGEDTRDEMVALINDTVRENPEWCPLPVASRAEDGTVTLADRASLRGTVPPEIAMEMMEWNRCLALLRGNMLDRVRRCAKPDCKKLFWARFSHAEYHDETCRIAVEAANPEYAERRRDYMREQREAERKEVVSVYKQEGSKYFWYGFMFKGKRVQKSTKVTNQREAENIEKAAWTQLARGEVAIADKPEAERKTIGRLLDALVDDFKDRKKDTTKNLNLIAMVKSELGEHYADDFKTKDVKSYVRELRKPRKSKTKGRQSKSLSNSTIKHRLQILASAYEVENAVREDEDFPPLRVPRYPKKKKREDLAEADPRQGFMDRAQFDILLRHLPEDLRDYSLFAYLSGWRKSAVAGLEWSDVRDGRVYLRGVLSKNKTPYYVPLLGELVRLIERRKEVREVNVSDTVVLTNMVFHRAGERVQEFRKSWASACEAAGLPAGQLFHDLRRSSCRNLIRSGCDRDTAKRIGGWKSDSILTRYNIITEDDVQQGMQKVIDYNEAESQKVTSIAR